MKIKPLYVILGILLLIVLVGGCEVIQESILKRPD